MTQIQAYSGYALDALAADRGLVMEYGAPQKHFKLEEGETIIRWLPPIEGNVSPFNISKMHFMRDMGPEKRFFSCACAQAMYGQPCAICAEARLRQHDKAFVELATPKLQILANIFPRSTRIVSILRFTKDIFMKLAEIREKAWLGGDYTDPSNQGFDTSIMRTGTGKQTKYVLHPHRDRSPLADTDVEIEQILAQRYDLNAEVDPTVPDELLEILAATRPIRRPNMQPQRAPSPQAPQAPQARVGANMMGRNPPAAPAPVQQRVAARPAQAPAPVSEFEDAAFAGNEFDDDTQAPF